MALASLSDLDIQTNSLTLAGEDPLSRSIVEFTLDRSPGTATVVNPKITMFKENGMANKKQQQQKKKMRDFKKKKSDQAKLEQARNADPAEKEDRKRASTRSQFGSVTGGAQKSVGSANQMHRPQGG